MTCPLSENVVWLGVVGVLFPPQPIGANSNTNTETIFSTHWYAEHRVGEPLCALPRDAL